VAQNELPQQEFRDTLRSLSTGPVSEDFVATVLARASPQQGSDLILAASLPRSSGRAETLALVTRIWKGRAADIPISVHPVFRLRIASTLHSLEPAQCSGCYEYARELLSAGDVEVRRAAALAMAGLGSSEDIAVLRGMVIVDEFSVAQSAAAALAGIAEADSVQILRDLMNDSAVNVQKKEMLSQTIEGVERGRLAREALRAP
jgi:hypothetical protein